MPFDLEKYVLHPGERVTLRKRVTNNRYFRNIYVVRAVTGAVPEVVNLVESKLRCFVTGVEVLNEVSIGRCPAGSRAYRVGGTERWTLDAVAAGRPTEWQSAGSGWYSAPTAASGGRNWNDNKTSAAAACLPGI